MWYYTYVFTKIFSFTLLVKNPPISFSLFGCFWVVILY